ncbi:hypothetical protein [Wolbachia endosymbiont of Mansonella ozzardi]|uniref:hypothetical protein n=1 Tax=Wolbachia endosymbiont of Mansonella ozzardi TaxID=137464 RepID=UPI001CE0DF08|nr:hypothetical protein [Wolbachia endosymbiont of Mansonella ozzardi]
MTRKGCLDNAVIKETCRLLGRPVDVQEIAGKDFRIEFQSFHSFCIILQIQLVDYEDNNR